MGIWTSAKLLVGVSWKEIEPFLESKAEYEDEDLVEILEGLDLDYASPCYDSDREDWLVGIRVDPDIYMDKSIDLIREADKEFRELTGIQGYLIVSPDVV